MVTTSMKLRHLLLRIKVMTKLDSILKIANPEEGKLPNSFYLATITLIQK